MEWFIKAFIRASLLWFAGGVALGVGIAVHPQWLIYRPAHAHMNVVGFLTMLYFEQRWRFIYTDLFQEQPSETAAR